MDECVALDIGHILSGAKKDVRQPNTHSVGRFEPGAHEFDCLWGLIDEQVFTSVPGFCGGMTEGNSVAAASLPGLSFRAGFKRDAKA